MLDLLWLIPTFPFLGFVILTLTQGNLESKKIVAAVGAGSIGLSFALALFIGYEFIGFEFIASDSLSYSQTLWVWMSVGNFSPTIAFYLDGLSLVMVYVITGVGFLIHLYSSGFMLDDPSYTRFFAYMNLFVGSMLTLVLANNLLLLYLGWEGVGLCSYLLIGFWYQNKSNGYAARKAFVVTRVGDTSMAIGMFLLFTQLGTLDIQELMLRADAQWATGSTLAVVAAALLLAGAVGKSAQLPLQTWLPDAMAGPTPISALIHAATMVTAGVYLIARTHILFELAPDVQFAVGLIGVLTLLMAGFTALTQNDIKRILAYSTISQIGYMFLALGVGAWSAAIFHLMTHAFFKALLFLAAGTVILSLHHEHNIFKMGGMRKQLPLAFCCFIIGSAALTALPFTSGFSSKELILSQTLLSPSGNIWFWLGGLVGAFFTAIYSFRLVFIVFFGKEAEPVKEITGAAMAIPLVVLSVLALVGGLIPIPLEAVFPSQENDHHLGLGIEAVMISVPIIGVVLSYLLFKAKVVSAEAFVKNPLGAALHQFWFSGWGMDKLYDTLLVKPFMGLARLNKKDIFDLCSRLFRSS